jgi:hypothetical protein
MVVNLVVQQASNNSIRVLSESTPIESTEVAQQSTFTATRRTAILRSAKDKDNKERRFIEVILGVLLINDGKYNRVNRCGNRVS